MKGVTTRAINELVSMERERIMELVGHLDNQHSQIQEQHKQIESLKQQIGFYSGMNAQVMAESLFEFFRSCCYIFQPMKHDKTML